MSKKQGADLIQPLTLDEKLSPKCCGQHIIYHYTPWSDIGRLVCNKCNTEVSIKCNGLYLKEVIKNLNKERELGNTQTINEIVAFELRTMTRDNDKIKGNK